ncbi:type I restriction endonuclease [Bacillus subtilis]|nr:type I restriction endonuclease [Pseudomonas sp. A29(2023)]MDL5595898.1 type I restriction endonuclease [Bacillus subtilis]
MQEFLSRINAHVEHVKKVAPHCSGEETTKQALILPLLDILGFSPYDPTKVRAEFASDFPGVKASERVDYALFSNGTPVMFIEAKAHSEKLNNHCPQLARYFNATPSVTMAVITNGQEWRFFTDLVEKNIMDEKPFLKIDLVEGPVHDFAHLYNFRHDEFQPDQLRTLAEENIYLHAFKKTISSSLREVDIDFVRYVAGRSNINRQLNARFLELITPLVRTAVERAVSEMVVSGLSAPSAPAPTLQQAQSEADVLTADNREIFDPDNPNIVTTAAEREVLRIVQELLGEEAEVVGKDNEGYYSCLYQGKTNRWLLRYWGDKKRPSVKFIVDLDQQQRAEINRAGLEIGAGDQVLIDKPENLRRIRGILADSLEFCRKDENFSRGRKSGE